MKNLTLRGLNDNKINKVESTDDTITGRGGMPLFSRYLDKIGILDIMDEEFGFIRKSSKGLAVFILFKQIFCFFINATSLSLKYFDELKTDKGYAAAIETNPEDMASSHCVKRFFKSFWWCFGNRFRKILKKMFIWRLHIEKPKVIELYIDSMVMDNDDAKKREGVSPTYKKKKGFHPLNIIWNGKIIDTIFRGGKKHCNAGKTAVSMICSLVKLIRKEYSEEVLIVLKCDAGFFDIKNFRAFDKLNIAFIVSGKLYDNVKELAANTAEKDWQTYKKKKNAWKFFEFGFRCESWERFFRAFYTKCLNEGKQLVFDFVSSDNVILTNIGINDKIFEHCTIETKRHWLNPTTIIEHYHQCGTDELAHRGFKDFGSEKLPFKKFNPNSAFFYCMVISFFLFQTMKEDVLEEVVSVTAYATTVRRRIIDIAAKIVRTGRQLILKISRTDMKFLDFLALWKKCQNPPPIPI